MGAVKIIVYGTLKRGFCNHHICGEVLSLAECVIKGRLYDTGYGYPVFEPVGDGEVYAELVEVSEESWRDVDILEGYPELYQRQEYPCKLSTGEVVNGWVYIMNQLPKGAEIIDSGRWN